MLRRTPWCLALINVKPPNQQSPTYYDGEAKLWAGRDTNMKWTEYYDGFTDDFGTFKEGPASALRLEYIRSPQHKTTNLSHLRYMWSPFAVGNDRAIYTPFFYDRQSYSGRDTAGHHRPWVPGGRILAGMRTKRECHINGYRFSLNFKPQVKVPKWLACIVHDRRKRRFIGFFLYANGCYVAEALTYKQLPRLVYNKYHQLYLPTLGQTVELNQVTYGKEMHSLELYPGHGAKIARAAGTSAVILRGTEPNLIPVLMPSTEVRLFEDNSKCVFGRRAGVMQRYTRYGGVRSMFDDRMKKPHMSKQAMKLNQHPNGGGNGSKWHLSFMLNFMIHPNRQRTNHWLSGYVLRGRQYNKHLSVGEIKERSYGWTSRDPVYR
eukprot:PhM_4_TR16666/c0_g1_i1/m.23874/K02886/RP-L2, MRPL2, rplB; large subunit ribosomal protein L2